MRSLIYRDVSIGTRNEMLCLTDMWRSAGGDESKRPVDWLRSAAAEQFIEYLAVNLEVGNSHLVISEKGGRDGGSTWTHWQIGLAYAKYLSPEFHAWCNEVVRSHYENRAAPLPSQVTLTAIGELFDEKLEPVHRDIANVQMEVSRLDDKVTLIYRRVDDIVPRREFSTDAKRQFRCVVAKKYNGECPCCRQSKIENDDGQYDHYLGRELRDPEHGWLTCEKCNLKMAHDALFKASRRPAFEVFQELRRQIFGNGMSKPRKGSPTSSSGNQGDLFS
jgi:KilA-N domain